MQAKRALHTAFAAGLRLRAEVFVWRWGWAWVISLVLAAAALAALVALQADKRMLGRQIAAAEERLGEARRQRAQAARTLPQPPQATAFDDLIAAAPHPNEQMKRILSLADRARIRLTQGSYSAGAESGGIRPVEVTLRFAANYPATRRFVESLLREIAELSVDRIALSRDSVAKTEADVTVTLTLWSPARIAPVGVAQR
jgi:hypothetical protein